MFIFKFSKALQVSDDSDVTKFCLKTQVQACFCTPKPFFILQGFQEAPFSSIFVSKSCQEQREEKRLNNITIGLSAGLDLIHRYQSSRGQKSKSLGRLHPPHLSTTIQPAMFLLQHLQLHFQAATASDLQLM